MSLCGRGAHDEREDGADARAEHDRAEPAERGIYLLRKAHLREAQAAAREGGVRRRAGAQRHKLEWRVTLPRCAADCPSLSPGPPCKLG